MANNILIFIPTYNERENVQGMSEQLLALGLAADILFLDDNSPDGTGKFLDELALAYSNLSVIHRTGKLGIGTAHAAGINWAYDRGYRILITMDSDFTHSPSDVAKFIAESDTADIVVGSRYMREKSLGTWNIYRKSLTKVGHVLTRLFLGMPYDATGAFRLYRLDRLPRYWLAAVHSAGYSFFFESLFVLHFNNFTIREVAIDLPARVYGHSKMRFGDALHSLTQLMHTYFTTLVNSESYEIAAPFVPPSEINAPSDPQNWSEYWSGKKKASYLIYDLIAAFYRKVIIRPSLKKFITRYFNKNSLLLHAGCGSGQVDRVIGSDIRISALDISKEALSIYKKSNKNYRELILGSIFDMPIASGSYDGIYNLGVMEHFTEEEIARILAEFNRILKYGGRIVLFWPPEFGLSVMALKLAHFILNRVLKKNISLHPEEITRVKSRAQVNAYLEAAGFHLLAYSFGIRDLFTYAVVVGEKRRSAALVGAAVAIGVPQMA